MIPAGYMYKRVALRPEWLQADHVADIYSVSGCISSYFADYINFWMHNGYWLFDSPQAIEQIADDAGMSLLEMTLFYYEVYGQAFDERSRAWAPFSPDAAFATNVVPPRQKQLHGFDVVTFMNGNAPECSPLSCNHLAADLPVNRHCLFDSLEAATQHLESGAFSHAEPGPRRILAVYTASSLSSQGAADVRA